MRYCDFLDIEPIGPSFQSSRRWRCKRICWGTADQSSEQQVFSSLFKLLKYDLSIELDRPEFLDKPDREWRYQISVRSIESQSSEMIEFPGVWRRSQRECISQQTLRTLELQGNVVRPEGAKYLAEALKINQVREEFSRLLIFPLPRHSWLCICGKIKSALKVRGI